MTTPGPLDFEELPEEPQNASESTPSDVSARATKPAKGSRAAAGAFLRSVWRIHFYAAIFSAPVLALLSVTGLAILYTDNINALTLGSITRVEPGTSTVSLDAQQANAIKAAPDGSTLTLVNTPREADQATHFQYSGESGFVDIYVNPYTGAVTGEHRNGDDLVGLANSLHGYLANDSVLVQLPSLAHLINPESGELMQEYVVGGLIIEIAVVWALVLVLSGIYLWWPRRSEKGKRLLIPRLRKPGRLRWRDLHATAGALGAATMLIFIITGMPWSGYWGTGWRESAKVLTPPTVDPQLQSETSTLAKEGDVDRFGRRISWATQDFTPPASQGGGHEHHGGSGGSTTSGDADATDKGAAKKAAPGPEMLPLASVDKAAKIEGMLPGYRITMPRNNDYDPKNVVYGSFTLENFWPMKLNDEQTVYLDQFSGKTLARTDKSQFGALSSATEMGVLTHMGTQFGILNKIAMTLGCLLILASIGTSLVMWWLRRPAGKTGLPRRPAQPRLAWGLAGIAAVLAVIYPLWGVTLIAVLLFDYLLVQRIGILRRLFNLNPKSPAAS